MNKNTTPRSSGQASPNDEDLPRMLSLADLVEIPELLKPPVSVAARFVWAGRTTLLAGREKYGKSTLARNITAAVSQGRSFLGQETRAGTVLYFALEEHLSDVVCSLVRQGANPDRVVVVPRLGKRPQAKFKKAVEAVEPGLIVVDTLAAYTSCLRLEPGSSSHWTPVLGHFQEVAEDSDAALLILHHARKSDDEYRDSSAIGAGPDMILTMKDKGGSEREIQAKGRFSLEDFRLRYSSDDEDGNHPRYELVGDEPPLEERIATYVAENSGCSTREIREGVRGKAEYVRDALKTLEASGRVVNAGDTSRHEWMLAEVDERELENPQLPEPGDSEESTGWSQEDEDGRAGAGVSAGRFPEPNPRGNGGAAPASGADAIRNGGEK